MRGRANVTDTVLSFKIAARAIGSRELVAVDRFEIFSLAAASIYHGDIWNARFAWTDRFRSTMYIFDELTRRWRVSEVIN